MKKIIAMYLPQFHRVKENDEWWGEGHTEWVSCKKAIPHYKGHNQPRVPLDNNYYDLTDLEVQKWQANLAKKNNIYGFCYYHYWFEGKLLLEKPLEQMLANDDVDLPFCISWANHSWSNAISRKKRQVLIEQRYGEKTDWINHFNYLLKFFKDERYICVDNKPMLVIYDAKNINCWPKMRELWIEMSKDQGFDGLHFVSTLKHEADVQFSTTHHFDAQFEYFPRFALGRTKKINYASYYNIKRIIYKEILKKPCVTKYLQVVEKMYKITPKNGIKTYLGAYVDWDTTARWGKLGEIHVGSTPTAFYNIIKKQCKRSENYGTDFIFLTAWNEWSEGAYLEPDTKYNHQYLESIRKAITDYEKDCKEM